MNANSTVTMLTQGASMGSLDASKPRGLAWLSLETGLQGEGGGIMYGSTKEHWAGSQETRFKSTFLRLSFLIYKMHQITPSGCSHSTNVSGAYTREDSTHRHHQIVNTKIRLIIFFAAKDGEALYSQQKQDWEVTVAQIMKSLLQKSDLN